MADLDVSDVLDDPDFWDPIQIITAIEVVGANGRASVVPATKNATGVVQPASSQRLERLPAGSRISSAIRVLTRAFVTSGQANSRKADIIVWGGNQYTVTDVQEWRYGPGYFDATCSLIPLSGGVP